MTLQFEADRDDSRSARESSFFSYFNFSYTHKGIVPHLAILTFTILGFDYFQVTKTYFQYSIQRYDQNLDLGRPEP